MTWSARGSPSGAAIRPTAAATSWRSPPDGTRLVDDVYTSIAAVEAELFANLDAAEIDTLQGLLARIKASADDQACKED
jgi:hypothetical protein